MTNFIPFYFVLLLCGLFSGCAEISKVGKRVAVFTAQEVKEELKRETEKICKDVVPECPPAVECPPCICPKCEVPKEVKKGWFDK